MVTILFVYIFHFICENLYLFKSQRSVPLVNYFHKSFCNIFIFHFFKNNIFMHVILPEDVVMTRQRVLMKPVSSICLYVSNKRSHTFHLILPKIGPNVKFLYKLHLSLEMYDKQNRNLC